MTENFFISIYLDTRRSKENGKYPVKLRVFTNTPRKQKLYGTTFEFTKSEFASIWETTKPRIEHKSSRLKLQTLETRANEIASSLEPFSFDNFEKKLMREVDSGEDICYHYKLAIENLAAGEQVGTKSNYESSLKAFKKFIKDEDGKEAQKILFSDITPQWLERFERYYTIKLGKSSTTVSMYVRTLRTVFNAAISQNEIPPTLYPFHTKANKNNYKIPSVKRVKKALNKEQLGTLFNSTPKIREQKKAKDFFLFSFSCNGINVMDYALLKYENYDGETLRFIRKKSNRTRKENLEETVIYLNKFSKSIIRVYGNKHKRPKGYLFPILSESDSADEVKRKVQNFTKSINQNLKKLAIDLGITSAISTQWARHSWATKAIKTMGLAFAGVGLNHSDPKTTTNYFAGFEDETQKEFAKNIMDFK